MWGGKSFLYFLLFDIVFLFEIIMFVCIVRSKEYGGKIVLNCGGGVFIGGF